ncbi:GIY-YIG nuclease family protein [Gelidibacter gilvus]|uniref:GIY-YIG nuclease family protein n=1 Tax=Gelidibacter gilvus TaxID=59602 RepID=A0A4Q0XF83_9FLAO|nr:GIY-YIG nuclease family protein [Gelidibacter gilvus]RXJ49461.1 GIY-YIG nuclease family protein [Gelidibacter gilvus]
MFQEKNFFVYIMINKNNSVIYVGFSGQVYERVQQHKKKYSKGFANKYNLNKLVYYEKFEYPNEAIKREKQIKKWNREWKINLINDFNPSWDDLSHFLQP